MPQTSTAAIVSVDAGIRKAAIAHIDVARIPRGSARCPKTTGNCSRPVGFLIGDDYVDGWPGVIRSPQVSFRHGRSARHDRAAEMDS